MKKLVLLLIALAYFSCANVVNENGGSESGDSAKITITNNYSSSINLCFGTFTDVNNHQVDYKINNIAPSTEAVEYTVPSGKDYDIWYEYKSSSNYTTYILLIREITFSKFHFITDGSYKLNISSLNSYNFQIISEPGSLVTYPFTDNNTTDRFLFPEINDITFKSLNSPITVINGNIALSGENYIYGVIKVKNNGTDFLNMVEISYNYFDENDTKAFDENEMANISAFLTKSGSSDYSFYDYRGLPAGETGYFLLIDSFETGYINNSDIKKITLSFNWVREDYQAAEAQLTASNLQVVDNNATGIIKNTSTDYSCNLTTLLAVAQDSSSCYLGWDYLSLSSNSFSPGESRNFNTRVSLIDEPISSFTTILSWNVVSTTKSVKNNATDDSHNMLANEENLSIDEHNALIYKMYKMYKARQ